MKNYQSPNLSSPSLEQWRVLVVEDAKHVAEVLAMFFEMEGMKAAMAFDGVEAVEMAQRFNPHLICMDVMMPRMNGMEAALKIREILPQVVIVAISGKIDDEVEQQLQAAGFDHHLQKPVAPDDLRRLIDLCLPMITRGRIPPDEMQS